MMSRSARHLGLAVVLCVLGLGFWTASALADDIVLCKSAWSSYVKARYGHCGWGETEIPLSQESPKTFFVTSATFWFGAHGSLVTQANGSPYNCSVDDGLDAGDCICQRLADASDMVPGGTYKAWLSVSGDLARSPSTRWTHPDVPYVRVDGVLIANNYEDLVDSHLLAKPNLNENGLLGAEKVWTGTDADGTPGGDDCQGWTYDMDDDPALIGLSNQTDLQWTQAEDTGEFCDGEAALYCAAQ